MAISRYGVNDNATVKLWAKLVEHEALKATPIGPLIGDSPSSIIHRKDELSKEAGDRIRYTLFSQLEGAGVTEGTVLLGNEESLENYTDDLLINELHHAIDIPNGVSIDTKRVVYNLRDTGRHLLRDWFAKRLSTAFFNTVCGNTAQTDTKYTGMNATIAPSSTRRLYAGSATTDQGLGSSDTFTLDLVYHAKEMAQTVSPKVKPINPVVMNSNGGEASSSDDVLGEHYVMFLHPYQVTDLKRDMSDGEWHSIQRAALTAGEVSKNPIFTGALGIVDGVILKRADDVTLGCDNSTPTTAVATTRRAVLLGAQAASYGRAAAGGSQRFKWVEELKDYERVLGISVQSLWGMKKVQFNSVDYGVITVSTYAAAHT